MKYEEVIIGFQTKPDGSFNTIEEYLRLKEEYDNTKYPLKTLINSRL